MTSNINIYPCFFTWSIYPPFVPWQSMEAKFYHEAPTVTEWHAILNFAEPLNDYCAFLLSLVFDTRLEERVEIVANTLAIYVYLGGRRIAGRRVSKYSFSARNRYTFRMESSALMFAQMEPYLMVIEIEICLDEDVCNEENLQRSLDRNPQEVSFQYDLVQLSQDLNRLAVKPFYANMSLKSSGPRAFGVHSYILLVRWNNFFRIHRFVARSVVRTNISSDLLQDILIYMYSGRFDLSWPDWANVPYITELFQVINLYGIYHLYKVFVKSDSSQLLVSKKSGFSQYCEFSLHFVSGQPISNSSIYLYPVEYSRTAGVQYPEYEFMFQIQVGNWNRAGAWLSYSLRSRVKSLVYAQVNLEMIKMIVTSEEEDVLRSKSAHARNYNIGPNEYVESGPVLFLGCPATFGDFTSMTHSDQIQQSFRFNISFTDGTTLDEVQSFNNSVQGGLVRLEVLSNHMYKLWSQEIHTDMIAVSRSRYRNNVQAIRHVHKAILAARIPRPQGALDGLIGPEHGLPGVTTVILSPEALPYVLDYIYTGKMFNVPEHLVNQISDFAIRSNFSRLKNLMSILHDNYKAME